MRKVTSVECSCVYNKSGKCKHVAGLIYYVNHEESLTKTNLEQQWGKPTLRQLCQEKYSKGKNFHEMFPLQTSITVEPCDVDISELIDPSPLRAVLLEAQKDKTERSIKSLMDSMLKEVDVMLHKEDCVTCINSVFVQKKNYLVYSNGSQRIGKQEGAFYLKHVLIGRDKIVKLCCDTMEQSQCDKWFDARYVRISASKNAHTIKSRCKKPIDTIVTEMLYPKQIDTPSLRYGRTQEPNARLKYEELYECNVKKVGVIVSESQPWLCASPDGFILVNGTVSKIVEFKCPSSCEKKNIVDRKVKKCNVSYLKYEGDKVILRQSSIYYTQCQVQIYVCGLSSCDLFIYSPVPDGSVCIEVLRNDKFIKEVISKCETFYFQDYLPKLCIKAMQEDQRNQLKTKEEARCFTGLDISNEM